MTSDTLYDHRAKAGNRGDLFKHAVLAHVVRRRVVRGEPFLYAESHAGYPLYHLEEGGAWREGAGSFRLPPAESSPLGPYWRHALAARPLHSAALYPGSTLLVHRIVADGGGVPRLCLWDRAPVVVDALRDHFAADSGVAIERGDGYRGVAALRRADLVLVDPIRLEPEPIGETLGALRRRGIPFLCWFPRRGSGEGREERHSLRFRSGMGRRFGVESVRWRDWAETTCGCGLVCSPQLAPEVAAVAGELRRLFRWLD